MSQSYSAYFIGGQQDLSKRTLSLKLSHVEFGAKRKVHDKTQYYTERYTLVGETLNGCLVYEWDGEL